MWIINAFLSAFFAGLTSILSKIGLEDLSSHYVTALRTTVVLLFTWLMYFITGSSLAGLTPFHLFFIILSGIATGMSWLCYYRALSLGDVSQVVPIDKLSIVVSILFASFVLHEKQNIKTIFGLICIVASTLLLLIA